MTRIQEPLSLEYILLGFINQGPVHGYELIKNIKTIKELSILLHIKQGMVYAMLEKLEEVGLISSFNHSDETQSKRKEYHITLNGEKSFLEWVTNPVDQGKNMQRELLAKLYFSQHSGKVVAQEFINEQKSLCEKWLSDDFMTYLNFDHEQSFERMIVHFRISQTHAILDWLDYCLNEINGTGELKPINEKLSIHNPQETKETVH